jgi:hypothetical protein
MAVERAHYSVEISEQPFEVRDYAPAIVASVQVDGAREDAVNAGFRILAGYIFGDNQTQGKIAMTAPVTQSESAGQRIAMTAPVTQGESAGQRIAMTAPVTQGESAGRKLAMTAPVEQNRAQNGWEIRFTMPAAYTMSTLPKPRDARVHLVEIPARRTAAITFSGFWSDSNLLSHRAQLLEFLISHHLTAISAPVYAFYDPPWTPWFWRTNEVLVDVASSAP